MGYCGWDYCAPYDLKRLFYKFPTSRFAGKSILSATFVGHETWSASCDGKTIQLWRTKSFSSSTTWNSSDDNWLDKLDTRDVAKGYSSSCPGGDVEFDATSGMKYAAAHDYSYTSFGLRAGYEDDRYGWKRFSDDAYLRVHYNATPKQIKMSQLSQSPGGTCKKPDKKAYVRSLPKIYASNVTDPDGDEVSVRFQAWWDAGDGKGFAAHWTSAWSTHKKSGATFSTTLPSTVPKNKTVAWYAQARDYDQGSYYSSSPWSGAGSATGCYMVYDTTVPAGPSITTGDYPAANDDDPVDPAYDGVGRYGTFTVDSSSSDVVKYCWGVNVDAACDSDHSVSTSGGAAKVVSFRPTRSGTNFLYVQAFDAAGNGSEPNAYEFRVKSGQPTLAQWKLDDATGATEAKGTAGARTVDIHGGAALGAAGTIGTAAHFDGVDDYLQSDIPTVHTDTGFSVAAWVKLDELPTTSAVIAAQPGNARPGFQLYYSQNVGWAFNQYGADSDGASPITASQGSTAGITPDTWVHLVGSYDSANDQLKLYVNGTLVATKAYSTPWDARRGLQIGSSSYDGNPLYYFPGSIDDVRLYDKPLTVNEATALHDKQPLTGRPARTVFGLDEPATDDQGNPTSQVTGRAEVNPAVFQGGATPGQPGVAGNALSLDGVDDYATTTPHINNQRDFSVVAWAKLPKTKPDHAAVIAAQTGTTKPGFELYYSPTYGWSFNQYSSDDSSGTPQRAAQGSGSMATGGVWTQIGGSYDAHDNYLRLYVQGQYVARVNFDSPFYAGGPLQLGASAYSNGPDSFFPGQIADVQLYDRALSAPEMADLHDNHTSVEGRWKLDAASGTPATSADDLAREDHTPRPLTLGSGASIDTSGSNNMIGTGGLLLNGTSTGYAATTASPLDTSASFTAGAWVTTPSRPQKPVTVMSMAGASTNGFAVRYVPDSTDPANAGRWQLVMADADSTAAHTATAEDTNFQNNTSWNHLAVVYDAAEGQMRLYVDGQLQTQLCADDDDDGNPDVAGCTDAVSWNSSVLPFNATKGLQLGRIKTGTTTWGEYWPGVIDDVWLIDGAATDTQVATLASGDDLSTTAGP